MILHSDRYFEHHYDVKLDMVSIKWPTIETIYLPEIFHSVSILVENVINYNIRNLLVDASKAQLNSTHEEANRVVQQFLHGLKRSRLEKLARIESENHARENMLKQMFVEINQNYPYETRFFKDHTAALKWLELR